MNNLTKIYYELHSDMALRLHRKVIETEGNKLCYKCPFAFISNPNFSAKKKKFIEPLCRKIQEIFVK